MSRESKTVLAFDFGASGGRAITGTIENNRIKMQEVHRFSNDPVTVRGTMYWDTLRQFFEIKHGITKAAGFNHSSEKVEIASLGIDTWGVDFGLIDRDGRLLENAVHYRDSRTAGMPENVYSKIPMQRLYEITGSEFNYFNTIFQLNSLVEKRPDLLHRADKLLFTPDLFNYFLTGEKFAEYTMATTSSLLDIRKRVWSEEILSALKIDRSLLPEIIFSGNEVGTLSPEICEELSCDPLKVIAVASHDTQSASLAVPTQKKDFIFLSSGTWSLYGTELSEPVINEKSLRHSISNEGGFDGRINFLKNLTGMWMVQESRRQWIREGTEYSFGELEELARSCTPLQNFVDANHEMFVPAGNIPRRIREYCRGTSQPVPQTPGEIVCCIDQSLALRYRRELAKIEDCLDRRFDTIHIFGGGIQSRLLCQMTANATGRRVIAGPVEATALGNIAAQLIALGELSGVSEAREVIQSSEETTCYEPQDTELWDEAYEKFRKILRFTNQ